MATETNTGLCLFIALGEPATNDQAGYEALTWVEIGYAMDAGEGGTNQTEVNWDPLKGPQQTDKGNTTFTGRNITFAYDPDDLGQQALRAGAEGANRHEPHSLQLLWESSGQSEYTSGKVFNFTDTASTVNNIRMGGSMFKPNRESTYVDAP